MAPDPVQWRIEMASAMARIETTLLNNTTLIEDLKGRVDEIEAFPWKAMKWSASGIGALMLTLIAHAQGAFSHWPWQQR